MALIAKIEQLVSEGWSFGRSGFKPQKAIKEELDE